MKKLTTKVWSAKSIKEASNQQVTNACQYCMK